MRITQNNCLQHGRMQIDISYGLGGGNERHTFGTIAAAYNQ